MLWLKHTKLLFPAVLFLLLLLYEQRRELPPSLAVLPVAAANGAPPPTSRVLPVLALPASSAAWEPPPLERCGPRGGVARGVTSAVASASVTILLPRAESWSHLPTSWGNAVTCTSGFRLHAYRGVRSTSSPEFNLVRSVVLARDVGSASALAISELSDEAIAELSRYDDFDASVGDAFFYIDSYYESSIGHFVMESALFLCYWDDLRALHPGRIKLVLSNDKMYKRNVLRLWGLRDEDIVTGGLPAAAALPSSVVYFAPLLSLHEEAANLLPLDIWRPLWDHFIERLRVAAGTVDAAPWSSNNVLVLLRGKKENLKANDRTVPLLDLLGQLVPDLVTKTAGSVTVMIADRQPTMREQLRALASASVIISEAGSTVYFNAQFARNATWFIINDMRDQQAVFGGMRNIHEAAARFNQFVYVKTTCTDALSCAPLLAKMSDALGNGPLPSGWRPPMQGVWEPLKDIEFY